MSCRPALLPGGGVPAPCPESKQETKWQQMLLLLPFQNITSIYEFNTNISITNIYTSALNITTSLLESLFLNHNLVHPQWWTVSPSALEHKTPCNGT